MNRFAEILKQVGARLEVPASSRTRILLEMAADLEDSYRHYREQGLSEAEAERRAEEAFGLSDETAHLLGRIHEAGSPSVADSVREQIGTLWSKVLLVVLLGFELFLGFRIVSDRSFFIHPSPFVWPIAVLAVGVIVFTAWKLGQILGRSRTDVRGLRSGLGIPLFVTGASLAIAGLGFLYHLQRFFRLNAEDSPESLFMNFAGWMISISSLMSVGLLTAILAALVWFVLSGLVTRSETREVEGLLQTAV